MNDDTFAGAYSAFHPQVLRFLRGMLAGRADAADLAPEVFLRLHASGDAATEGERVRFWLFRVARNLAVHELRRSSIRERLRAFVRPFVTIEDPHERSAEPSSPSHRSAACGPSSFRPRSSSLSSSSSYCARRIAR